MKITDHKLTNDDDTQFPFIETQNYYKQKKLKPKYIVIHYTAGSSAESSISWLCNPEADASAHLVIGRDGTITQLVPFDKPAWHAGRSSYKMLTNLNLHTIGIELDNAGMLKRVGNKWYSWFGREYPANEVLEAKHRYRNIEAGWHIYPEEQIDACFTVCVTLKHEYKTIRDILGHDDVSIYGKVDPGPAFDMEPFRDKLFAGIKPRRKRILRWIHIPGRKPPRR